MNITVTNYKDRNKFVFIKNYFFNKNFKKIIFFNKMIFLIFSIVFLSSIN